MAGNSLSEGLLSRRTAVPILLSLASHGIGVLALGAVRVGSLTPPPEPTFIELVAATVPPERLEERVEPPVTPGTEPRPETPQTPRPPVAPGETPPTAEPTAPEIPPDFESTASLSDILTASQGSNSAFSLAVPEGAAVGAVPPDALVRSGQNDTRPPTTEEREAALEAELSARLHREANARAYLSQRPPPELQRRRDGSYQYSGPRFSAIIDADGTVRFEDRGNVNVTGPGTDNGPGLAGTFDITDALQGASGQDPMRAERRWFMRETRELRERLEDEAREQEASRGVAGLERRLRQLWTAEGSAEQKRQRIFSFWRDTSDDEVGERARNAIVGFVRRNLPAGSDDAYTTAELGRMNGTLSDGRRFTPY